MIIEQVKAGSGVTLSLNCRELLILANGLCELDKVDSCRDKEFYELHRDIYTAFEIMSHGHIDSTAVSILQELQQAIDKEANDK